MNDSNSTRDKILSRIRSGKPAPIEHPDVPIYTIEGDKLDNFKYKLESFDGKFLEFPSRTEAIAWLDNNLDTKKKKICSAIPDFSGTLSVTQITDPHDAHTLDASVAQGVLGVGETGSVYVTEQSLGLAAAALLSPDLYLLLNISDIVDGISAAYEKIDLRADQYGSFFSGPSATADIEAVHITGAQGPVSLTVLLYS